MREHLKPNPKESGFSLISPNPLLVPSSGLLVVFRLFELFLLQAQHPPQAFFQHLFSLQLIMSLKSLITPLSACPLDGR